MKTGRSLFSLSAPRNFFRMIRRRKVHYSIHRNLMLATLRPSGRNLHLCGIVRWRDTQKYTRARVTLLDELSFVQPGLCHPLLYFLQLNLLAVEVCMILRSARGEESRAVNSEIASTCGLLAHFPLYVRVAFSFFFFFFLYRQRKRRAECRKLCRNARGEWLENN